MQATPVDKLLPALADQLQQGTTLKTLVAAVQAAGLVDTLKGDGPFTVFAPTDEAFAKLPAGTVEDLLKPENKDKLTAILTYHVVDGKVMASDVVGLDAAPTLNGQEIGIMVDGDSVMLNENVMVVFDGSNSMWERELGVISQSNEDILWPELYFC